MLPLLCAPLAFWACGDGESNSGTSANGSVSESDLVVATFDDLPVCSDKRDGATAYVKDEKTAYICEDGKWISDDETDGDDSSSSVKPGSSSSSVNPGSSSSKKDEFLNPKVSYGEMTDTRDNKTYKTVKIGTQVWMAENLNYYYNKGTAKSYCYGGIEANCEVAGRLYTWAAAIDSVALANDAEDPQTCGYGKICTLPSVVQGVCPSGWHLPTYDEWRTLFKAVGGSSAAGKALKSGSGWHSNGNGTDAYGFSALPAGGRNYGGNFYNAGYDADFWSASQSEEGSDIVYGMYLYYGSEAADVYDYSKDYGNSVRCLQNSN